MNIGYGTFMNCNRGIVGVLLSGGLSYFFSLHSDIFYISYAIIIVSQCYCVAVMGKVDLQNIFVLWTKVKLVL